MLAKLSSKSSWFVEGWSTWITSGSPRRTFSSSRFRFRETDEMGARVDIATLG